MQKDNEPGLKNFKRGGPITPNYGGRDGVDSFLLHPFGDVGKMVGQRVVNIGRDIPHMECDAPKLEECCGNEKPADNGESQALEPTEERIQCCSVVRLVPVGMNCHHAQADEAYDSHHRRFQNSKDAEEECEQRGIENP